MTIFKSPESNTDTCEEFPNFASTRELDQTDLS